MRRKTCALINMTILLYDDDDGDDYNHDRMSLFFTYKRLYILYLNCLINFSFC